MLDTDSRCFVHHMVGLLPAACLARMRARLIDIERAGWGVDDERASARVRIGAATDAIRLDAAWYEPWRAAGREAVERLRPYTWLLYPVMIRHLTADAHLVPWHQDIGYFRRMERVHRRLITCFVSLEPEPWRAASLEFAAGTYPEFPHASAGDHGAAITGVDFAQTIRFPLASGDVLAFGDHTPHRTIPGPDGSIDRWSFEFRAVIPQEALPDKDYYDLETGLMVRIAET